MLRSYVWNLRSSVVWNSNTWWLVNAIVLVYVFGLTLLWYGGRIAVDSFRYGGLEHFSRHFMSMFELYYGYLLHSMPMLELYYG